VDAGVFTGAPVAVGVAAISGTITFNGTPLGGIGVLLSGAVGRFVQTDLNGNYSFAALPAGNYLVTPSQPGFSFSPTSRDIGLSGVDVTGRNFGAQGIASGIFAISGKLTNQGVPLSGIPVTLSGLVNAQVVTNVSGDYSFDALPPGKYRIRPTTSGGFTFTSPAVAALRFAPRELNVTVTNASLIAQDFGTGAGAQFSISGAISGLAAGEIPTIQVSGPVSKSILAVGGNYIVTGLAAGEYIVTPTLAGRSFSPSSRTITLSGDVGERNFGAV
jgi:hypothetical protein